MNKINQVLILVISIYVKIFTYVREEMSMYVMFKHQFKLFSIKNQIQNAWQEIV